MQRIFVSLVLVLFGIPQLGGAGRQKVIFDCDLAGDIDDAFAAALLLTSPEIEVLGFVMDHGNTAKRAQVACRLLYEVGREDIPVVVGKPTANIVGVDTGMAGDSQQFAWGAGFERVKPIQQDAAEFIVENLRKYPGEVILFTVGPVCNLPAVIAKDPEALKKAKRIVAMFGSFHLGYGSSPVPSAEWNVRADIKAAQAFASCGAPVTYVGLDVTTFVKLNEENRQRLLLRQSPLTNSLCGLYSLWRYESYSVADPSLFDAVAVGVVLWPDLFTSRRAHVRVTDEGFTVIDESQTPNGEVVLTINQDEFIRRAMERYLKQNLLRGSTP
jgi:inosine-uridine nucleoside N-ribohydrolase